MRDNLPRGHSPEGFGMLRKISKTLKRIKVSICVIQFLVVFKIYTQNGMTVS